MHLYMSFFLCTFATNMNTTLLILIGITLYILVVNTIAFALYGVDKSKAKNGKWRIQEATLILVALLGGAPGAWIGMRSFCHKTRHKKFTILIPLTALVQGAVFVYITWAAIAVL